MNLPLNLREEKEMLQIVTAMIANCHAKNLITNPNVKFSVSNLQKCQ